MTADVRNIIFEGSIHFVSPPKQWWKSPDAFEMICDALRRHGLWLELPYVGRRGTKLRRSEPTQLASWSTKWVQDEDYGISRSTTGLLQETTLSLTPRKAGLQFYLVLHGNDAELHRRTLLDAVVALATDLREREMFGGVRLWSWTVSIGADYPLPRPLLYPELWAVGLLLLIIDRDYFLQFTKYKKEQVARELEHVLVAPLPQGATREDHGPLAIFRFIRDLTDAAAIDRARSEHHRWMASLVASEKGTFTNEHGDARVLLLSSERRPPLTLYDAVEQHGYKAVFLTDDGGGDADLDAAAQWLAARQLPDGTPVHGITIIAPTRDVAIAARERAARRGFNRLVYIDNNGDLWNPFANPSLDRS